MSRPANSQRRDKPRGRNTSAMPAPDPCPVCGRPSEWSHHVAGRANAPEVTVRVCRRCADLLDAFLRCAGVKLRHGEPRTEAELAWAPIAGLDGLRAARDAGAALSPEAVAVGRLVAVLSSAVRGPQPAERRQGKRRKPIPAAATFEAACARATHDLLARFPGAAEQHPRLLALLQRLADPDAFIRVDATVEPLHIAHFEQAVAAGVELLDIARAAFGGDPHAEAALELAGRRFACLRDELLGLIERALDDSAPERQPGQASA